MAQTPADFLATPLQFLKGVGPRRAAELRRAGLATVEDLLYRFPFRYEDRAHFASIASLRLDQDPRSIVGEIVEAGVRYTRRRGFKIFEALVRDASGCVRAAWPNQTFLADKLTRGRRVVLYGRLTPRKWGGGVHLIDPDYEILDEDDEAAEAERLHTGRIVPVYERIGSVSPKFQRSLVRQSLDRLPGDVDDPLPAELLARLDLPGRRLAFEQAHFPPEGASFGALQAFRTPAQKRLIFEEFFLFQVGLLLRRREADAVRKPFVTVTNARMRESLKRVLPFKPTRAQKDALAQIVADMKRPHAMNRLLQGDVGSGKTIVALQAAVVAMENGLQVAFMAPTEILAEQHFLNIQRLLATEEGRDTPAMSGCPGGIPNVIRQAHHALSLSKGATAASGCPSRFRVALLTGAVKGVARRELLGDLAAGRVDLLVGTHALVQEGVEFQRLGLVVIDEQHRFGVVQRATLRAKGLHPDVLVMTATPIPRTLALTVHGDLDVSVIREMPPGRLPIKTTAKPETRREDVYEFLRGEIEAGRQAYVIYPLIEESAKVDLKAATEMADHLAHDVFPQFRVALLHGRMKQDAKDRVMRAFAGGQIDIVVSTTVIEVGIDVSNATAMIVEHAERFGLSQLHQLRGRVGRGRHASHCILLYQSPLSDEARRRLEALVETTDGFVIAERDLQMRGPGDFVGTRQSGMPTLRVGDLVRDDMLMVDARREAEAILASGSADRLVALVRETWGARFGLAEVG
jgi:ATP-dependent DNA helicase RecG